MPHGHLNRKAFPSTPATASPPTTRVARIVELLVHNEHPMSVAEIASDLSLSRSTATAVLVELERLGWVDRLTDRRYGIGPSLASIAHAIDTSHFPLCETSRTAVAELSRHTQGAVAIARIDRGTMTFVYLQQNTGLVPTGISVGSRLPLEPPVGAAAVARRSPREQQEWLTRAPAAHQPRLRTVLDQLIDRGVGAFTMGGGVNGQLLELLADIVPALDRHPDGPTFHGRILAILAELGGRALDVDSLSDDETVAVSYLTAPVLDRSGYARYEVLLGLLREVSRRDLLDHMEDLRRVAQSLSSHP